MSEDKKPEQPTEQPSAQANETPAAPAASTEQTQQTEAVADNQAPPPVVAAQVPRQRGGVKRFLTHRATGLVGVGLAGLLIGGGTVGIIASAHHGPGRHDGGYSRTHDRGDRFEQGRPDRDDRFAPPPRAPQEPRGPGGWNDGPGIPG